MFRRTAGRARCIGWARATTRAHFSTAARVINSLSRNPFPTSSSGLLPSMTLPPVPKFKRIRIRRRSGPSLSLRTSQQASPLISTLGQLLPQVMRISGSKLCQAKAGSLTSESMALKKQPSMEAGSLVILKRLSSAFAVILLHECTAAARALALWRRMPG